MLASNYIYCARYCLALLCCTWLLSGCDKAKETPKPVATTTADPADPAAPAPVSSGTNKTSFADVTRQLDPGGSLYVYLGTEQWLSGLSTKVAGFKELLGSLPEMGTNDMAEISMGFDVLTRLIRNSGIEEITGVGVSGVRKDDGLYRTRSVIHHYPGQDKGYLWKVYGREPHELEMLDFLPATTVAVGSGDLDLTLIWNILETEIKASGFAPAIQGWAQLQQLIQNQLKTDLRPLLESVPGPFLVAVVLDEQRIFAVPTSGESVKIPEPGLIVMAKVKDRSLYDLVAKLLPPDAPITKTNIVNLDMLSMPLPMGLPFSPTVGQSGDFFFVASHPRHVENFLGVRDGKTRGLKATDEFKKLAAGLDLQGNFFSFVGERFGKAINDAVMAQAEATTNSASKASQEFMRKYVSGPNVSLAVASNTPEGWVVTAHGNQNSATLMAGPLMVVPVAVIAGLMLPALSKAKDRAQTVRCANNLKQICLAGLIYANDHDDTFPSSFMAMKDELTNPGVLTCPNDPARQEAASGDWTGFNTNQITYEFLLPGVKEPRADQVVFRCPVHQSVGMGDGSVRQGSAGQ